VPEVPGGERRFSHNGDTRDNGVPQVSGPARPLSVGREPGGEVRSPRINWDDRYLDIGTGFMIWPRNSEMDSPSRRPFSAKRAVMRVPRPVFSRSASTASLQDRANLFLHVAPMFGSEDTQPGFDVAVQIAHQKLCHDQRSGHVIIDSI
jgi:hypothetical protein